jgi:NDP-sugar pyrophosphorylase family protein
MTKLHKQPDELRIDALFQPGHTIAWDFLSRYTWLWEALPDIGEYILELGSLLDTSEYKALRNNVWIHKTATIAPTAYIGDSVIIGAGANVRHCAFIRENALVGDGAVIGNSSELKNVILFDEALAPHYNYVGDSILGYRSHMGAGAITSNVKSDHSLISVLYNDRRINTNLKKFGAILGDCVEIGCNSVLNPGSIIGPAATVYPLSMVRGYIPAGSIYKRRGEIVEKHCQESPL